MLVNAADMLKKAEAGKYALGAFNTNNLEWTLAILQAAEEAKSPLILQCTAGAAKWMGGFKVCADMVKAAVEATGVTVPVALHLDARFLRGLLQVHRGRLHVRSCMRLSRGDLPA